MMTHPAPISSNPPDGKPLVILVTGFKPFEDCVNISEEVVKALPTKYRNIRLVPAILTVDKEEAACEMEALVARHHPDFIVSLGEVNSGDTPVVDVELMAAKPTGDIQDTTIAIHKQLNNVLQKSAHRYFASKESFTTTASEAESVCHRTFFSALAQQEKARRPGAAIFVHLMDLSIEESSEFADMLAAGQSDLSVRAPAETVARLRGIKSDLITRYTGIITDLLQYIDKRPTQYLNDREYATRRTMLPDDASTPLPPAPVWFTLDRPIVPLKWEPAEVITPPLAPATGIPKQR